ncbi:MAG: methyltransferase domain-containing protein, partial [Chloroflexi bacterium]|nr:methyltransferase domain-containing protein [Chloroflexota bacterium]
QELWRRPFWIDSQFYDATIVDALAETLFVENGQVTIEVSEPIPNIEAYVEEVKIAVQVAGAFVGFVSIPVQDDLVTAQAIRTAITETCSLELSRVAVREGLIGQPFDDHGSLQTRLHSTSVTIRGNQPVIEPGTLPRSAPATARIFDEIQAQREQIWAVGRYAHGEIGTAVSRRATLPTSVAELVKTAVATQTVTPIPTTNNRPPQTIIYLPEWHPGEQYSQENAEPDYDPNNWGNHFENVFHQQRDPWKYTCPYEQIKFAQTLSLLPAKSFDNVLEIGCAEGHFTTQLAPYANTLLATDISDEALIHASERCAGLEHVSFQEMDLRNGTLPESCDLIVCSEMLYFMDNELTMKQVAAKIAGALTVGGYLLTAHANLTVDDPNSSGFSWEHPFGGKRIGEIFAHTTGLQMVK